MNLPRLFTLATLALALAWGALRVPARAAFPGLNGKISFAGNRDASHEVYVTNTDGSAQTNLTNDPAEDDDARWSPDGTRASSLARRAATRTSGS